MPRHSSFQVFADTNTKVLTGYQVPIPTSSDIEKLNERGKPRVETEKIRNPTGSIQGAGSSEFHLYTLSRKREITRLESLEENDAKEKELQEYREKAAMNKSIEEERERKNAEKRKKKKMKKLLKRKAMKTGDGNKKNDDNDDDEEDDDAEGENDNNEKEEK